MKDAFKKELEVGDEVLYSTSTSAGTTYVVGKISKLYPHKASNKMYAPADRVAVKPTRTTRQLFSKKDPIVYASNVVLIKGLK